MERVTLSDVAQRVGVSAKTVSNVVNGNGRVGAEVRARVQQAIDELGYRPNLAARELRGGPSGMIAVALPDLRQPYFAELAAALVTEAQRRGRTVVVTQTGGIRSVERDVIESRDLPRVDLIILSPLELTGADLAERRSTTPLVLLGEQAGELRATRASYLSASNVDASRAAVEYLLEAGRTRVAAIGVQRKGPNASSTLRLKGYREALAGAGVAEDPALLREVETFTRPAGTEAVDRLIAEGVSFDALFCFNDSLAFGALHALAVEGIRVPGDVAVIGFDDVEEASYTVPTLTTIGPGPAGIASRVFALVDAASDDRADRTIVEFDLRIRESA
jgi:DNA-binding LacI/PurR family transcriptional regulator